MDVLTLLRADLGQPRTPHTKIREVATKCGVPYYTLRKLAKGYTKTPSFATAEALRLYYARELAVGRAL